ncbi:MAG: hypothetical protein KKG09_04480 [Verrucomicrobia bacterium]|nr:hypothetical protein [Verrucomicrobiota bacterium]MCG2680491.1 hypothetical protein [Kiritimatiellia bacterium]MBU4247769.1 hypothetical protein [Verrucomicrobiota bacterium]MBU4289576.1 hypothetical protein [Verrucomicrobiota bacterium]MBU4428746.1 hypothetical protein [Verrucomicrobiota bacterium]
MTDPTNKVDSGTASATVTPAVEITNYSWTLTGVTVFTNNITATNTPESSIIVYETRAASGAYQGETLAVEVAPWGYTAETNFTVVKADIVWPDLVETNEETIGGWVKYNSDDDDTNGVVDAEQGAMENDKEDDDLLAITLELAPGGLPTNETVSISCEGCWLDRQKMTNAAGDFGVDRFPLTVYVEGQTISQTNRKLGSRLDNRQLGLDVGGLFLCAFESDPGEELGIGKGGAARGGARGGNAAVEQVWERLEELRGYRWSSYRAYAGYVAKAEWFGRRQLHFPISDNYIYP